MPHNCSSSTHHMLNLMCALFLLQTLIAIYLATLPVAWSLVWLIVLFSLFGGLLWLTRNARIQGLVMHSIICWAAGGSGMLLGSWLTNQWQDEPMHHIGSGSFFNLPLVLMLIFSVPFCYIACKQDLYKDDRRTSNAKVRLIFFNLLISLCMLLGMYGVMWSLLFIPHSHILMAPFTMHYLMIFGMITGGSGCYWLITHIQRDNKKQLTHHLTEH